MSLPLVRGPNFMGKLIYGFNVSVDGYIADAEGSIDWSDPSEELHQCWNDFERETSLSFYGRSTSPLCDPNLRHGTPRAAHPRSPRISCVTRARANDHQDDNHDPDHVEDAGRRADQSKLTAVVGCIERVALQWRDEQGKNTTGDDGQDQRGTDPHLTDSALHCREYQSDHGDHDGSETVDACDPMQSARCIFAATRIVGGQWRVSRK